MMPHTVFWLTHLPLYPHLGETDPPAFIVAQ